MKRIKCAKFDNQFFILPSVGVVYKGYTYKIGLSFAWLGFGMRIVVWRGKK